jgi:RNA polymerase sigma-32 factor
MINWKSCEPLTDEEMDITARKAVAGDRNAIEKLVQSNVKLAAKLARQYRDFDGMIIEDLTSEALIGLIEAIPTFDVNRGTKFTTYAAWRMRMRVFNFVIDNFRLVRIGTTQNQRKLFWRLNRETEALKREGIDPTDQAVADRLQVKVKELHEMQIRMNGAESSLDATLTVSGMHEQGSCTLFDILDSGESTPEEYTTKKRMTAWVQDRMIEFEQGLKGNYLTVWNLRIASEDPMTMDEIGKRIGRTRQRVEQIDRKLREDFLRYARKHK